MPASAADLIALFHLEALRHEGGFFRRTYTSAASSTQGRSSGTAIYFLITPADFSALHTLVSDELWHFYAGDPVEHLMLDPGSDLGAPDAGVRTHLGIDFLNGQLPQLTVPGGVWQGARLAAGPRSHGWALLGCTLSPGWEEREFTLGDRDALIARFPTWADDIRVLTR